MLAGSIAKRRIPLDRTTNSVLRTLANPGTSAVDREHAIPGSTLIWFLAELEATAAYYSETTAWHFVIACFKLCDHDTAKFLLKTTGAGIIVPIFGDTEFMEALAA